MVGRVMRTGRVSPMFFVDAEFAEQVSRVSWCPDKDGYLNAKVGKEQWSLHQYIWFLANGRKAVLLEHLNHAKTDCRLANLEESTCRRNLTNRGKLKKNGLPRGVYRNNEGVGGKTFFSTIWAGGKANYLGAFKTVEEASKAYEEALSHYL
jgi:hypothetical protein